MPNSITGLNMVALALIHAFDADNVSRVGNPFADVADRKQLAGALIDGWKPSLGVIGVYKLSKEQQAQGVKERTAIRESLKAAEEDFSVTYEQKQITVSASDCLRAWEGIFLTDKGKIIVPQYGQVFGFRRKLVLPEVNAVRRKLKKPAIDALPVHLKTYENDLERYEDCITENTQKNVGTRALSNVDRVHAAQKLFFEGSTQSNMRKVFKDGMGQKLYALCTLDKNHASLNIVERVVNGDLDFGPLGKEEMRKLHEESAEAKEVDVYLKNPKEKKNEKKMAAKSKISTAAKQFPVELVARTLQAVLDDNLESLNPLIEKRDELNKAVSSVLEPAKK